jgi:hypothetical protein
MSVTLNIGVLNFPPGGRDYHKKSKPRPKNMTCPVMYFILPINTQVFNKWMGNVYHPNNKYKKSEAACYCVTVR